MTRAGRENEHEPVGFQPAGKNWASLIRWRLRDRTPGPRTHDASGGCNSTICWSLRPDSSAVSCLNSTLFQELGITTYACCSPDLFFSLPFLVSQQGRCVQLCCAQGLWQPPVRTKQIGDFFLTAEGAELTRFWEKGYPVNQGHWTLPARRQSCASRSSSH